MNTVQFANQTAKTKRQLKTFNDNITLSNTHKLSVKSLWTSFSAVRIAH